MKSKDIKHLKHSDKNMFADAVWTLRGEDAYEPRYRREMPPIVAATLRLAAALPAPLRLAARSRRHAPLQRLRRRVPRPGLPPRCLERHGQTAETLDDRCRLRRCSDLKSTTDYADYTDYMSFGYEDLMKLQKQSPERALRPQAGVKPLHKSHNYTSPEGAAEWSVTPSGFVCNAHGSRGFTPACGLFRPSALRVGDFNKVST